MLDYKFIKENLDAVKETKEPRSSQSARTCSSSETKTPPR